MRNLKEKYPFLVFDWSPHNSSAEWVISCGLALLHVAAQKITIQLYIFVDSLPINCSRSSCFNRLQPCRADPSSSYYHGLCRHSLTEISTRGIWNRSNCKIVKHRWNGVDSLVACLGVDWRVHDSNGTRNYSPRSRSKAGIERMSKFLGRFGDQILDSTGWNQY